MSLINSQSSSYCGHSAEVVISLLFNGQSIPVAQLGPGFLLLDAPSDHPAVDASLTMRVDHVERSWRVRLPNGIRSSSKRVAIIGASCGAIAA
jgi:hypothetical protein